MGIQKNSITLDGLKYNLDDRDRVAAQLVNENATISTDGTGQLKHVAYIDNTTAFVRNDDSIVTWTQPANTIITAIHIFFPSSTYSTGTGNSLGFEVGSSSGAGEIVAKADDQIIDVGADGTDLATGAFVTCTLVAGTEDATTLAINIHYSCTSNRSVYLNTVESSNAAAIVTAGTARWIVEYVHVA